MPIIRVLVGVVATVLLPLGVCGLTIPVGAGESIQSAIDAAADGDTVSVAAGQFNENIDFRGKAIRVVGASDGTILHGAAPGPVARFASGETAASVLDSFTVTGGVANQGGGIYIADSSPTIVRNIITLNRAFAQGSAVYLEGSNAALWNNLITYNGSAGGDPHSVEIVSGAPTVINNTIARGDSNGIIVRSGASPLIMNNVIALNGARVDGQRRGRGICDFSGGVASIHYNVFYSNRVAALLTAGVGDVRRIEHAQGIIGAPRLVGNVDGAPRFLRSIPRDARRARNEFFALRPGVRSARAVHAGNPDPLFNNLDGTRNHAGFTGGPFAALP